MRRRGRTGSGQRGGRGRGRSEHEHAVTPFRGLAAGQGVADNAAMASSSTAAETALGGEKHIGAQCLVCARLGFAGVDAETHASRTRHRAEVRVAPCLSPQPRQNAGWRGVKQTGAQVSQGVDACAYLRSSSNVALKGI